ncbi:MAG TPA: hypothetical protein VFG63_03305, partial [Nocardioidaceae bacterium]|nr:hypothetical protein [Nocardioidaceae bacterium]
MKRLVAVSALSGVPLVLVAACTAPHPPVTQVEAIAACYAVVLDEEPSLEIDRAETRAEQGDEEWTITGVGTDDSLTFRCRVTPQG